MMRLAILGSTGSIGRNTLDVVDRHSELFSVEALAAGSNIDLLVKQAEKYHPSVVCIGDSRLVPELRQRLAAHIRIVAGDEGLIECASLPDVDTVVSAVVGARGLAPTYAAATCGKRICLANKEALVAGGSLVTAAVNQHGGQLLPVDSEHSAIFQCLQAGDGSFYRLYLTASGGPFRTTPAERLPYVTAIDALRHPTWNMGSKITIDSATLMNKGLEIIEAHWLFDASFDDIHVVVHPQSIVHSMVEFVDGSIIAQLGAPDMRLPIQVALMHPQRLYSPVKRLDPRQMGDLSFESPDTERFPSLDLAYAAGRTGGTMPAVLNAANEVAVELFLQGEIRFTDIPRIVEQCMKDHTAREPNSIDEVLDVDRQARIRAREVALALRLRQS
ncbi:MAG: 1-deoxy-D-xylulose-5-phosphate reductoisomerase [Firmicutes bacterium]|nr:1-deoxy-D-xylulose-5-phosphate reductoisomerase [Bacillota bacterium]